MSADKDNENGNFGIPGTISGSVTFASDYRYRGVSRTGLKPAIQGALSYQLPLNDETRLYAGVWGSNISSFWRQVIKNPNGSSDLRTSIEMDYTVGLLYNFKPLTFDLGGIYYSFPGAGDKRALDYWDIKGALTYDFESDADIGYSVHYSPDYMGKPFSNPQSKNDDVWYHKLASRAKLFFGVELDGHVGWQLANKRKDYFDWGVGAGIALMGIDLRLGYVDTSLSKKYCGRDYGGGKRCNPGVLFTAKKDF